MTALQRKDAENFLTGVIFATSDTEIDVVLWKMTLYALTSKVQKQGPKMFYKKGFLKNVAKFTGKHLCQSVFNKVAGLRVLIILK